MLTASQGALGGVLTVEPAAAARMAAGGEPPAPAWLARILGLRLLAQALLVGWALAAATEKPGGRGRDRGRARSALFAGAAADGLHAASMVVAAWRWPSRRRSAVVSGGVAAASALLGLVAGGVAA